MHWVVTQNGKRYLYHTFRANGRVRRKYLGAGEQAEKYFAWDQRRRTAARELKANLQKQLDTAANTDIMVADFVKWSDAMMRAALITAGFYLHERTEWRPRRGKRTRRAHGEHPVANAHAAGF